MQPIAEPPTSRRALVDRLALGILLGVVVVSIGAVALFTVYMNRIEVAAEGLRPVSYTHLDVYKRQGCGRSERQRRHRHGADHPDHRPGRSGHRRPGRAVARSGGRVAATPRRGHRDHRFHRDPDRRDHPVGERPGAVRDLRGGPVPGACCLLYTSRCV